MVGRTETDAIKGVTIRDVAKAAGVSVATASRALSGSGRMTDETRERVQKTARTMGFRANGIARSLSSRRSFTIGFLNNDLTGRLTLPVMEGVTDALFDQGVSVFLCSTEDNALLAQRHLETMLDKRVDGIIAAGKRLDRQVPAKLTGLGVPVVFTIVQPETNAVCFVPDDESGAFQATSHLIERGRRRIAHVTGPADFRVVHERAIGYRAALSEAGLFEPEWGIIVDDWSEQAGHSAVRMLFSGALAPPDGIFCGNDQIARGVVDALSLRGISVPAQVSVIGFDNWEVLAAATRPPLTTVDMGLAELGRVAGRTLLKMIEGETVEPGTRKLPCSLVLRQST